MAFRNDVSVDWSVSPRIIEVAAPSTSISIQDLYDTLRILESRVQNTVFDSIVSAGGKETLGGGQLVGITLTLLNAQLKFADRASPTRAEITGGNLVAIDENGDPLPATAFSTNVNAIIAQSSSATISGLDELQSDVKTLLTLSVADDLIASSGSTTTEIRTGATQSDNFYDGMLLVVENSAGTVARNIQSYSNTNGAFTLDSALPFTPSSGDRVLVFNQNELFNFISANAALIPATI